MLRTEKWITAQVIERIRTDQLRIVPLGGVTSTLMAALESQTTGSGQPLVVGDLRNIPEKDLRQTCVTINQLCDPGTTWMLLVGLKNPAKLLAAIGAQSATLIDAIPDTWLCRRNIEQDIRDLFEQHYDTATGFDSKLNIRHQKRDKICIRWRGYFVKTTMSADSPYNEFLDNEYRIAARLQTLADHLPLLLYSGEFGGRRVLVYENIPGKNLAESIVRQNDIDWICRELADFLRGLKRLNLVHNDLRLENILVVPAEQKVRVVDFEFGSELFANEAHDHQLPFQPTSEAAGQILRRLWPQVNRRNLGAVPLGTAETDAAALATIERGLSNRVDYWRRWLQYRAEILIRRLKIRLGIDSSLAS